VTLTCFQYAPRWRSDAESVGSGPFVVPVKEREAVRNHVGVSRVGPGLIDSMVRSAVLSGTPVYERKLPERWRSRANDSHLDEAAARFHQLCELTEAGILTREEFTAAVQRLTETSPRPAGDTIGKPRRRGDR
jgi:hypothetical protein